MQSISDLNKKIWYRLLKILFLLLIVILFIISSFIEYNSLRKNTINKSLVRVTCISNYSYFDVKKSDVLKDELPTQGEIKKAAINYCAASQAEISDVFPTRNGFNPPDNWKPVCNNYSLLACNKLLTISAGVMRDKFDVFSFIIFILSTIGIFAILNEITRRIVYYIALGKIFPKQ